MKNDTVESWVLWKKNQKNWEKKSLFYGVFPFLPQKNRTIFFLLTILFFPVKFCPPGVLEDVVDACIILLDHPLPPVSRKNATIHKKRKNLNEKISRKIN